jgi:hypothetical protein
MFIRLFPPEIFRTRGTNAPETELIDIYFQFLAKEAIISEITRDQRNSFKNLRTTYAHSGPNFAAAFNVITESSCVRLNGSTRVDRFNVVYCAGTRFTGGFNEVGE